MEVHANQGWQTTDVAVSAGDQVEIRYLSGEWFEDPPGQWHDASGGPNPWICGSPECHEPLPEFPKYGLLGQVGVTGDVLGVGNALTFVAETDGVLALRPNYGDEDIAALNPQGSVTVNVTVTGE